jgi:DNA invertase Pin-like site-specific DNA recombinase
VGIDRVGRSLTDLLHIIQHLEACGVDLYLDQQSIDTTTPMGKLVFQVTGAFAEFERTMIRQRVKAGLKRAVAQGVRLGRPKIDSATERKVRRQLAKGTGILRINGKMGCRLLALLTALSNVGYWGHTGKHLLTSRLTGFDRCC